MALDSFINLEDVIHLFLPSFLFCISFLMLFFILGSIIRSAFFVQLKYQLNTANLFYNTFIGMILLVVGISFYKTNLETINVLFLLVGGGFLYKRKELLLESAKICSNKVNLILIVIIYIVLYTVYFCILYQKDASVTLTNFRIDDLFYGLTSYHVYNQGIENGAHVINYVTDNDITLTYYHYFELWLTGFMNNIDERNINQTFALQVSTLISFNAVLGIYFLLDVYFRNKGKSLFFLLFFFIFFSPIYFSLYSFLFAESGLKYHIPNVFFGNEHTVGTKVTILLIPCLILFYFLLQRRLFLSTLLMSVIILLNAVNIPSMAVFSFFVFIYAFVKKDVEKWKIFVYNGVFYIVFVGFYYFHGAFDNPPTGTLNFSFWQELYFHVRLPFSLAIKNVTMYLPYFLIILIFGGKDFIAQHKKEIILYLFLLFCSSFVSSLFYKKINYIQIFSMPSALITYCFFFYFFVKLMNALNAYKKKSFIIILGILSIYSVYLQTETKERIIAPANNKFTQSFISTFEKKDEVWGVALFEMNYIEPYNAVSSYSSPFNFLSTLHSGVFTISLSHYGLTHQTKDPIESINIDWALQKDVFTLFINKQKNNDLYISVEQSRLDFILKYHPKFLALHDEKMIPTNFKPYLGKRMADEENNVIIYLLNYEK